MANAAATLPKWPRAAVIMASVVTVSGFLYGYDVGEIGGTLGADTFVKRFGQPGADGAFVLPNMHKALMVSMLLIGALVGSLVAGPIANILSRKTTIMIAAVVYIVGGIVQITADRSWASIVIGRTICGLSIGSVSVVVPMYNAECSPSHIRGRLGSFFQLQISLGLFIGAGVNFCLHSRPDDFAWRLPKILSICWAASLFFGMIFLPRSPRWMIIAGRESIAHKTIAQMHGLDQDHPVVLEEFNNIVREVQEKKAETNPPKWHEMFTGERMLFRVLLGCSFMLFQQGTGINMFFFYGTGIFRSAGLQDSYLTQLLLTMVNFICTFPATFIVERFGRRACLLFGSVATTICLLVFACVGSFVLSSNPADAAKNKVPGIIMVVFTCLYICGFAMTWGPIPWIVVSEIFPPRNNRAACIGLATSLNWITTFIISFSIPSAIAAIGFNIAFVFTAVAIASGLVAFFFMPETKGRSMDEVDEMILQRVPARKSAKWFPPARVVIVEENKTGVFQSTVEVLGA